ncbi:hypothetical protein PsorP6_005732 [Peronosclerospora sorghi]|uniref:Uncharacterized protein n=1 Tax=Peronosclerospora sorghi TaxID=230839 RepID=A0ACC0W6G2_9STRA|nr:hypothetical protein PsorP6_005732 [Peronosclerospora sorghi]
MSKAEVDSATPRDSSRNRNHRCTRQGYRKYDAATEAEYKTKNQFKVLRRLEEARDSLELAARRIKKEGIAKIIDPRTTLAQLEKEEKRRKREEETQEEKEKEFCSRKKIRLDQYKKYDKQAAHQVQRENFFHAG